MKVFPQIPSTFEEYEGALKGTLQGVKALFKALSNDESDPVSIHSLPPTLVLLSFVTLPLDIDATQSADDDSSQSISVAVQMSDPENLIGAPSAWKAQIDERVAETNSYGYVIVFIANVSEIVGTKVCFSANLNDITLSLMVDMDLESNESVFDIADVDPSFKVRGH